MVSTTRRVLTAAAAVVLMGVATPSFTVAKTWGGLRAQSEPNQGGAHLGHQNSQSIYGGDFDGRGSEARRHAQGNGRSLKSTQDPQCNLPVENPCTLNTTAIGMVESGSATYYDETCEAGIQGCYTDGVRECRTCYMSTEIYMSATNATEANRPAWATCPCCVPTTLEDSHVDIEVMNFNYTIFGISESACTDAPTQAPVSTGPTTAPAPTAAAPPSPAPTNGPTTATPAPTAADTAVTPAPEAGSRALSTPAPSVEVTPAMVLTPTPAPSARSGAVFTPVPTGGAGSNASTENLATTDSDDGLSTGAKVGIGAGAAVAVIIVGAAGFGVMKASGRA